MNEVDRTILEETNPVFNTAKMTLFLLAESGDKDAEAIVTKLGLTSEETQNSATTEASPEQIAAGAICMETRYAVANKIAGETEAAVYVDLPCGYTPRAIQFSRKGLQYIGMDLPAVIEEIEPVIMSMIEPAQRDLVSFAGVDATDYESLSEALKDIDCPVCITTEGLLMYFTDSEAGAFCDNIRRILERYGGVWIAADPENLPRRLLIMHDLFGDRFMEVQANTKRLASDLSDVTMENNPLILKSEDPTIGRKAAMDFLAKHGLEAERMILYDHLPELRSLAQVTSEQATAIKEALRKCAFWKITANNKPDAPITSSKAFTETEALSDGILQLSLTGRLDSITAPTLLAYYEQHKDEIHTVRVNCEKLDYISSAGLRVLLIMEKGCTGSVTLFNANEQVKEIMRETGFDKVFMVVK